MQDTLYQQTLCSVVGWKTSVPVCTESRECARSHKSSLPDNDTDQSLSIASQGHFLNHVVLAIWRKLCRDLANGRHSLCAGHGHPLLTINCQHVDSVDAWTNKHTMRIVRGGLIKYRCLIKGNTTCDLYGLRCIGTLTWWGDNKYESYHQIHQACFVKTYAAAIILNLCHLIWHLAHCTFMPSWKLNILAVWILPDVNVDHDMQIWMVSQFLSQLYNGNPAHTHVQHTAQHWTPLDVCYFLWHKPVAINRAGHVMFDSKHLINTTSVTQSDWYYWAFAAWCGKCCWS